MINDIYNSVYRSLKWVYIGSDLPQCYSLLPWDDNYKELSEEFLLGWMRSVMDTSKFNSIERILGSILIEEGLEPTYNPVVDATRVRNIRSSITIY